MRVTQTLIFYKCQFVNLTIGLFVILIIQVRVVPLTKISLLTENVPHLTNVLPSKGRVPLTSITIIMENQPHDLTTRLHGESSH